MPMMLPLRREYLLIIVVLVQALTSKNLNISWLNCTKSADGAVFDSVMWQPVLPILGDPLTVIAKGRIKDETVTNQSFFKLAVTFGYLKVLDHTGPLCGNSTVDLPLNIGQVTFRGLDCPQKPKELVTLNEQLLLPKEAPMGKYLATLQAFDQAKRRLLCAEITMKVF